MNSNWRNRPTTLEEAPRTIDWIVAIDESGTPDLKHIAKSINCNKAINAGDAQFTVTACAIKIKDFDNAKEQVMCIKNKYWENALYKYKDGEKRVCFHSKEIRSKAQAFNPNLINYTEFVEDISNMMSSMPIKLLAANIDKKRHIEKYIYPKNPYDLCMNFVLERLMWNIGKNETCYVILESRGKKEDKDLLDRIKHLIDNGNNQNESDVFSKIKGVYFNPKWSHKNDDKKSYWMLELADLCAFPIHKYLAYGTVDPAFDILKKKICCYPNIKGRGIKSFP